MLDNSRKHKILMAGLEEFCEYGFEKANTDRISKNAEVSKGLIFHHFGSKENLYMTVMNKCIDDLIDEYDKLEMPDTDFITKLIKMMEWKYDFYKKYPMHYKLMINGFFNTPKKLMKELNQRYYELKEQGFNIIIDIIKKLPLKKDVSIENVVTVIAAITNIVESKYIPHFTSDESNFDEFYDLAKIEYINLMNIVMHGILDNEVKEGGDMYERCIVKN